jgi:hypothetical protein
MDIDQMTIGDFKKIAGMVGCGPTPESPFEVGKAYLFFGVTRYMIGRVRKVFGDLVVIDEASWIPDTGRFSTAVSEFKLAEVERAPDGVVVNVSAITDAVPWSGKLPTENK